MSIVERRHVSTPTADTLDLMLAFSTAPAEVADAWIDNRLVGLTLAEIAEREGVSKAAIGLRCKRAEAAIRRYIIDRERRRCPD